MIEKNYLSANSYLHDIWRLAAKVRSGGFRPDVLIALWRGGAPVGVAVHEFLKASGWDVRHAVIKCASYTGINENDSDVVFEYSQELLSSIKADEKVEKNFLELLDELGIKYNIIRKNTKLNKILSGEKE